MAAEIPIALVGNPLDLLKENPRKKSTKKKNPPRKTSGSRRGGSRRGGSRKPKTRAGRRAQVNVVKINPGGRKLGERVVEGLSVAAGAVGSQIGVGAVNEYLVKPHEKYAADQEAMATYKDYGEPLMKVGFGLLFDLVGAKSKASTKKFLTLAGKGAIANGAVDFAQSALDGKVPGFREPPTEIIAAGSSSASVGTAGYIRPRGVSGYVSAEDDASIYG